MMKGTPMRPECERFVPLILRTADGTLAPGHRAELEAHAASCAECRAALEEQSAARRMLAKVDLPAAPFDFAARVRARIEPQASVFDLLNWRAWTLRLAPVAALLALLAWFPLAPSASEPAAGQTLPAVVDEWAGTKAQVAGGALGIGTNAAPDRGALLAAALGETSR
jgi:anti-sigma factor RsiW